MKRYLYSQILSDLQKKMVFITGPRQVGKTSRFPNAVGFVLRKTICHRVVGGSSGIYIPKQNRWIDPSIIQFQSIEDLQNVLITAIDDYAN